MTCPICKNTMGFVCGRCIECGYNYLTDEFEQIKVDVKLLEELLPLNVVDFLISEHCRWKMR